VFTFNPIEPKRKRPTGEFEEFVAQFPGPYGKVAYDNMLQAFFGAGTVPHQSSRVIGLSMVLRDASSKGIERVVLDLQPTTGALELMDACKSATESLYRLSHRKGLIKIGLGVTMPDLMKFMDTDYAKKVQEYSQPLLEALSMMKEANFFLVCGPEPDLVDEMLGETRDAVTDFGGAIKGYFINNIRDGLETVEASSQSVQIKRVLEAAKQQGNIPVFNLSHIPELNAVGSSSKIDYLTQMGEAVIGRLPLKSYDPETARRIAEGLEVDPAEVEEEIREVLSSRDLASS